MIRCVTTWDCRGDGHGGDGGSAGVVLFDDFIQVGAGSKEIMIETLYPRASSLTRLLECGGAGPRGSG